MTNKLYYFWMTFLPCLSVLFYSFQLLSQVFFIFTSLNGIQLMKKKRIDADIIAIVHCYRKWPYKLKCNNFSCILCEEVGQLLSYTIIICVAQWIATRRKRLSQKIDVSISDAVPVRCIPLQIPISVTQWTRQNLHIKWVPHQPKQHKFGYAHQPRPILLFV